MISSLVLAVAAVSTIGTAEAGATSSPVAIEVAVGSPGQTATRGTFTIQQTPTPSGRIHVTVSNGTGSVTTTVPAGAVVGARFTYGATAKDRTRAGSAEASVTIPDVHGDPAATIRAYRASGRSVVTDAMENGMTYEQAMAAFGDMAPESNPSKAKAAQVLSGAFRSTPTEAIAAGAIDTLASGAKRSASPAGTPLATAAPYDSWCVDTFRNGGDQTAHGCITRTLDYNSGGLRYWTNKQKVTGKDNSFWMVLSSATQRFVPVSGNAVLDWDPYQTTSFGNCGTYSAGVTDPKTGVNASYSGTICPDKFGPSWSDSNRGYGSFWGGTSNDYVGAHSLSVVKTSPGYSAGGTLVVTMSWRLN